MFSRKRSWSTTWTRCQATLHVDVSQQGDCYKRCLHHSWWCYIAAGDAWCCKAVLYHILTITGVLKSKLRWVYYYSFYSRLQICFYDYRKYLSQFKYALPTGTTYSSVLNINSPTNNILLNLSNKFVKSSVYLNQQHLHNFHLQFTIEKMLSLLFKIKSPYKDNLLLIKFLNRWLI